MSRGSILLFSEYADRRVRQPTGRPGLGTPDFRVLPEDDSSRTRRPTGSGIRFRETRRIESRPMDGLREGEDRWKNIRDCILPGVAVFPELPRHAPEPCSSLANHNLRAGE